MENQEVDFIKKFENPFDDDENFEVHVLKKLGIINK
jgi:hypothetical protein